MCVNQQQVTTVMVALAHTAVAWHTWFCSHHAVARHEDWAAPLPKGCLVWPCLLWLLGPTRVHIQNGTLIGSAILCTGHGHDQRQTQTYHGAPSTLQMINSSAYWCTTGANTYEIIYIFNHFSTYPGAVLGQKPVVWERSSSKRVNIWCHLQYVDFQLQRTHCSCKSCEKCRF